MDFGICVKRRIRFEVLIRLLDNRDFGGRRGLPFRFGRMSAPAPLLLLLVLSSSLLSGAGRFFLRPRTLMGVRSWRARLGQRLRLRVSIVLSVLSGPYQDQIGRS